MEQELIKIDNVNNVKINWERIAGLKFIGTYKNYIIHLDATPSWAVWSIEKDGKIITHYTYHSVIGKGELDSKVKIQKILTDIINNHVTNKK